MKKDITINSKAGVRVRYVAGPATRLIGQEGILTGRQRNGMLCIVFDGPDYFDAWPGSLERVERKPCNPPTCDCCGVELESDPPQINEHANLCHQCNVEES